MRLAVAVVFRLSASIGKERGDHRAALKARRPVDAAEHGGENATD